MDELRTGPNMTVAPVPLRNDTLADLPSDVLTPSYDRDTLTPGIVHIGVGNFHRAHQAWYTHRLMQADAGQDWAIIGAGVRPADKTTRQALSEQNWLTTLIELGPQGRAAEVCGSMIDYVPVEPDNAALIAQLAAPNIRIVSLTVTEGGYFLNPATGAFDDTHPEIAHDIAHPETPGTAFGAIVAALARRKAGNLGPFTIQSCDNLRGNGDITRATVLAVARLNDPELAAWIETHCSFPNSMVDCIVPATGPTELAQVRALGIDDALPVTHENFRQWVMEDDFCAGRPDWDHVGATFTPRVHDYEAMKIRILNAGHQVLANAGELLGADTISDCMMHPLISKVFRKIQVEEIAPYVAPVPGMTPDAYVSLVESRFSNPAIGDTSRRVAFDGSSRHTGFVLPILRDAIAAGGSISGLSLVEALWARMCAGVREDGSTIAPNDPIWDQLHGAAHGARVTPQLWLEQDMIYGDLAQNAAFASAFSDWLTLIWSEGTEAALKIYLAAD